MFHSQFPNWKNKNNNYTKYTYIFILFQLRKKKMLVQSSKYIYFIIFFSIRPVSYFITLYFVILSDVIDIIISKILD